MLIMVKNMVPFIDSQFENLVLEAYFNNHKYYLCNVYRAPSSSYNESQRDLIENFNNRLEELMTLLNVPHTRTLIFLDSNINLLKLNTSQLSAEYIDTCHANGFIVTNFKATHICNNSYSLIDQILSNSIEQDCVTGSIVCDISDHFPIFYSYDDVIPTNDNVCKSFRPMSFDNMSRFRDQLRMISWNHVLIEQDVNVALEQFLDTFLTIFELYFPTKVKRKNCKYDRINEFMTRGLLISRIQKNLLYNRLYRNIYNSLLRKSKKMYFESNLKKYKTKPKKNMEHFETGYRYSGAHVRNSRISCKWFFYS
jgi:hypothetical protein